MYEVVIRFVIENFFKVFLIEDFKIFSVSEVLELVNRNDVNVIDEIEIFEVCIGWIEYDIESRK